MVLTRSKLAATAIGGVVVVGLAAAALLPGSPARFTLAAIATYKACDFTPTPGGVVALGDSITAGHHVQWLGLAAQDSYFDVLTCDGALPAAANLGTWMHTSHEISDRVDEAIALDPSAVFLIAGTNDVRQGDAGAVVGNVAATVAALEAAGARVVVGTLPPSNDFPAETILVNASLRDWAATQGVTFFDGHAPLAAPDGTYAIGMSEDGIHPSRSGARVLADAALTAYLEG